MAHTNNGTGDWIKQVASIYAFVAILLFLISIGGQFFSGGINKAIISIVQYAIEDGLWPFFVLSWLVPTVSGLGIIGGFIILVFILIIPRLLGWE